MPGARDDRGGETHQRSGRVGAPLSYGLTRGRRDAHSSVRKAPPVYFRVPTPAVVVPTLPHLTARTIHRPEPLRTKQIRS
ncbi:hypothetical protein GCM10022220_24740 [Actinocatenispora rupis]|uniref:Uncharacterized protein n=1 Tax=Actinocatenispora rupis TaxID=519421 RepID=A0A8J3J3R0_9ACTN|nr:hypothetical protein Aru02nite_61550 [Actinocatenispora rupis]